MGSVPGAALRTGSGLGESAGPRSLPGQGSGRLCVGSGQAWGATLPPARVGEVLENVPRWPFILSCTSRLSGARPEACGGTETPSGGPWTQLPVALLCSGLTLGTHLLSCGMPPWWSGRPRGSRPPHRRSEPHKRGSVRWASVGGVSGDVISPLPWGAPPLAGWPASLRRPTPPSACPGDGWPAPEPVSIHFLRTPPVVLHGHAPCA